MQRSAFGEPGRALKTDDRPLVELTDGARPGIRERRAHARGDRVEQVLDARASRVDEHAGAGYALLEERLAGPVVGGLGGGAVLDGARGRHAERLLVGAAVGTHLEVAGRLEGAREPGADHDVGRPRGQRQRDVAGMPDPAVGPDVGAELTSGGGALEDRGELRPADPGHHPGRAHRPRPDADLDDVGAGLDEVAHADSGDDVARADRHAEPEVADRPQGLEHLVLVAVGGVDDEEVDAPRDELLGPAGDIAVDADRGGDAQMAVGVDVRAVDGRPQRALPRQDADEAALGVDGGRQPVPGAAQSGEGLLRRAVLRDGDHAADHHVAHLGEPVDAREVRLRDQADGPVLLVDDDGGTVGALLQQGQRGADGLGGVHGDGGVVDHVPGLDVGHDVGDHVGGDVLGDDGDAAPPGHRLGHPPPRDRGHVGDDDGDGVAGAVVAGQVDVHPRRHRRAAGHHEHVVVGQVERRLQVVEETHRPRLRAPPKVTSGLPPERQR